jgi:phosphate transport system protein
MMTELNVRKTQDEALDRLREQLLKLGNLAQDAIRKAVWALGEEADEGLSKEVLDGDDVLDELASAIEEGASSFTARYQPVAQDLRTVSAINRMAIDLERVGDLASASPSITCFFFARRSSSPSSTSSRMAAIVEEMIDGTMRAFINRTSRKQRRPAPWKTSWTTWTGRSSTNCFLLMIENPRGSSSRRPSSFSFRGPWSAPATTRPTWPRKTIYMVTQAREGQRIPKETGGIGLGG